MTFTPEQIEEGRKAVEPFKSDQAYLKAMILKANLPAHVRAVFYQTYTELYGED